jgi:hypothetical protein
MEHAVFPPFLFMALTGVTAVSFNAQCTSAVPGGRFTVCAARRTAPKAKRSAAELTAS